ncbi:MAG: TMEM175 family protein [Bacteriovoracaceae bacterium]
MYKGRLEAFSDGVLAIIITIMVLEIKVPHDASWATLFKLAPVFFSYVLSFIYVGIYWNNHHHLFQSVKKVDGKVLWANLGLLFSLSLVPFASGWMGANNFEDNTVTLYGIILLMAAFSYYLLTVSLLKSHDRESVIAKAIGNKIKERISLGLYISGVFLSYWYPRVSFSFYVFVAILWLIPDSRIEKEFKNLT